MFKTNKYSKLYFAIIDGALRNPPSGYSERHHIIPKSLGGTNKRENLVNLSPKQHYVCHLLLTKMVSEKRARFQMASALKCMSEMKNDYTTQRYTSRLYSYHRRILIKELSDKMSGSGNHNYGKKHSLETRKKISEARTGQTIVYGEEEKRRRAELCKERNTDPAMKEKMRLSKSKEWLVNDPAGTEYKVRNLSEFCREHNLNVGNMNSVSKGKLKQYKGWTCSKL